MKDFFDFPMTRNQIVEFRSRNGIGIKTRYKISSFIRLKYAATTNLFIKTEHGPATGNSQLFTNEFGGPLFDP